MLPVESRHVWQKKFQCILLLKYTSEFELLFVKGMGLAEGL